MVPGPAWLRRTGITGEKVCGRVHDDTTNMSSPLPHPPMVCSPLGPAFPPSAGDSGHCKAHVGGSGRAARGCPPGPALPQGPEALSRGAGWCALAAESRLGRLQQSPHNHRPSPPHLLQHHPGDQSWRGRGRRLHQHPPAPSSTHTHLAC